MTPKRLFTALARAEVVTWSLVAVGVAASMATRRHHLLVAFGIVHVIVLVGYLLTTAAVAINHRWRDRVTSRALLAGVIPYATPWFLRWVRRRRELDGDWRLRRNGSIPHSRKEQLLAWTLRRPAQAAAFGVAAAVAVVSAVAWSLPEVPWVTP